MIKTASAPSRFWPTLFIILFFSALGLIGFLAFLSDQSPRIEALLVDHWWIAPACLAPLGAAICIWALQSLRDLVNTARLSRDRSKENL
jgi:hypothetical protein